jgi:single-strand DNA-binding protein
MGSINKAIIVGNVCQNPEVKFTKAGQAVCSFSVATNEKWTDKDGVKQEKAEFHRIVAWGKLAEICGEYLSKGSQVYVEGKIETRKWEGKDGNEKYTTEIVAKVMTMLGGGSSSGGGESKPQQQNKIECPRCKKTPCKCNNEFADDDIDF